MLIFLALLFIRYPLVNQQILSAAQITSFLPVPISSSALSAQVYPRSYRRLQGVRARLSLNIQSSLSLSTASWCLSSHAPLYPRLSQSRGNLRVPFSQAETLRSQTPVGGTYIPRSISSYIGLLTTSFHSHTLVFLVAPQRAHAHISNILRGFLGGPTTSESNDVFSFQH